jgi:hypothetical protein
MKLREILSYIFISIYENDCYSFLEFQKINPTIKKINKEKIHEFLKQKYRNEFFFLTFNQYKNLTLPEIIKSETIINILNDSKSFEDLKKGIENIGVLKAEKSQYLEFLSRISENLESIETIRNCVAHNRQPTNDELTNYVYAKQKLEKELDEFIDEIKIKRVISGVIALELVTTSELFRQNSTTITLENGDEVEIDTGDLEIFKEGIDEIESEAKKRLIQYLKSSEIYDGSLLFEENIEISYL